MTTGPESPTPPPEQQPPSWGQPQQWPPPPPHAGQPGQAPWQQPGYSSDYRPAPLPPDQERIWAIAAHLGPLVLGIIAPLVVWLVFRDRSAFLDRSGKEALNMQISYLVYGLVSGFSIILLIGLVLLPVIVVAWFVLMVVATVRVAGFEDYRYPLIFRWVS